MLVLMFVIALALVLVVLLLSCKPTAAVVLRALGGLPVETSLLQMSLLVALLLVKVELLAAVLA